jgi:Raf kinase inhibitor-like YbhB/YbcL family protein
MRITSSAFAPNGTIPKQYTCSDKDLAPPLSFEEIPSNTSSLALIVDDPDAPAGTWVHWVVYNMPGTTTGIAEGAADLSGTVLQGVNDFKKRGYGGPCPPPGKPHRYFFKLYALDSAIDLPRGASKGDLEMAMDGHILGQAELIGLYSR